MICSCKCPVCTLRVRTLSNWLIMRGQASDTAIRIISKIPNCISDDSEPIERWVEPKLLKERHKDNSWQSLLQQSWELLVKPKTLTLKSLPYDCKNLPRQTYLERSWSDRGILLQLTFVIRTAKTAILVILTPGRSERQITILQTRRCFVVVNQS